MSQAKNWVFTINNPTAADVSLLASYADSDTRAAANISYMVYQKELSESGTPHFQGYVQLSKRQRQSAIKALISPRSHVEVARGKPADNVNYCTKADTRTDGPWHHGELTAGQGKRNDLSEFVTRASSGAIQEQELIESFPDIVARYPRFVDRVQRLYSTPQLPTFIPRPGWQADLRLLLFGEASPRKVYWYWEQTGNTGKSHFALNFADVRGRSGYVVTGGRHADIYFAYKDESTVFFDWARDSEDAFPYRVVETFKNGYFLNTKYETHARRFKVPHVVVFANFPPDQSKLSADRWTIKEINTRLT